jgi:hypothetical protein
MHHWPRQLQKTRPHLKNRCMCFMKPLREVTLMKPMKASVRYCRAGAGVLQGWYRRMVPGNANVNIPDNSGRGRAGFATERWY